jgi:6-pyruvoyltetrahydropterin/6-carboxytetrahydropterin synthase
VAPALQLAGSLWLSWIPSFVIPEIAATQGLLPISRAPQSSSLYLRVVGTAEETHVQSNFRVQVSKDYLVFASAHFITFRGHQCETLHGHNYRVGVAVEGSVDSECLFVLDFSVLKQITRRLVDAIDHKVLLPTLNPKLAYREDGDRITVDYFGEPTYVFPRRDCALIPILNSTAEMLAQYLGVQVRQELASGGYNHLTLLELEVEENYGQSATYREALVPD